MNFSEFKNRITCRGTSLNEGISENVEEFIISRIGVRPTPLVIRMFECFDGFPEGVIDSRSGIRIWPLLDVLSTERNKTLRRRFFADFLLNSNEISFDISDECQPILYDNGDKVADNLHDFLNKLSSGDLDFL